MNGAVEHPSYYNTGKYEVIDVIDDWGLNFAKGNAVKYIARAGRKNPETEIQDLEKASWYINHEIRRLKNNKANEKIGKLENDLATEANSIKWEKCMRGNLF